MGFDKEGGGGVTRNRHRGIFKSDLGGGNLRCDFLGAGERSVVVTVFLGRPRGCVRAFSKDVDFESNDPSIPSSFSNPEYSFSPGSSSFVGQLGGTLTPAVRKNSIGETKVSNVPAGSENRCFFILCSFRISQESKSSTSWT